jgi:hypothetical protein
VAGRLIGGVAAAAAALVLAGGGGGAVARAQTDACPAPPYPGDSAPRAAIAEWLAYGAAQAALPRELPVMAALVESGLTNLQVPDSDPAGYFQMRMSVWNQGDYAGFTQQPELQLRWFADQATRVRRLRLAEGAPDPGANQADWGEWIADVQRPGAQFRGRYQLRLAEARGLIGAACVPAPLPGAAPGLPAPAGAPPAADTIAPALAVTVAARQRSLHRGAIVITAGCPAEPCIAAATATLHLPRARRPPLLAAAPRVIAAGQRRPLRFALRGELRRRVRKALRERASVAVTLRVLVVDAARNASARTRRLRITG